MLEYPTLVVLAALEVLFTAGVRRFP